MSQREKRPRKRPLRVNLSPDAERKLRERAESEGISASAYGRRAIMRDLRETRKRR